MEKIHEAVRAAESRTSADVEIVVADMSDHYLEAEILGGVILAGVVALPVSVFVFNALVWSYLPVAFLLFFPARFLMRRSPALKVHFVGDKRKTHAVRERAARVFYGMELHRKKRKTGILFYLSILERKVWVLAGRDVHERLGDDTLQKFAGAISGGIKSGRACEAVCETLAGAGEALAAQFPPEAAA